MNVQKIQEIYRFLQICIRNTLSKLMKNYDTKSALSLLKV